MSTFNDSLGLMNVQTTHKILTKTEVIDQLTTRGEQMFKMWNAKIN